MSMDEYVKLPAVYNVILNLSSATSGGIVNYVVSHGSLSTWFYFWIWLCAIHVRSENRGSLIINVRIEHG